MKRQADAPYPKDLRFTARLGRMAEDLQNGPGTATVNGFEFI
jgi:hypothetical protein